MLLDMDMVYFEKFLVFEGPSTKYNHITRDSREQKPKVWTLSLNKIGIRMTAPISQNLINILSTEAFIKWLNWNVDDT